MFSGFGISADGINFALALRAGLYFRADEQTIPQFEAEGSKPFQYQTRAKTVTVNSYWQLPARLFDDSEELAGGRGRHWRRRSARRCASGRSAQGGEEQRQEGCGKAAAAKAGGEEAASRSAKPAQR